MFKFLYNKFIIQKICKHKWLWHKPKYIRCSKCKCIKLDEVGFLTVIVSEADDALMSGDINRGEYNTIIQNLLDETRK